MSDIEIAQSCIKEDIKLIANKIGLDDENLILYGNDKAKIKSTFTGDNSGKLILVTAINPTPYGEGKTTVSIGLGDALNILDKKPIIVLREPSMGPVFGIKGGATGGGYSQVVPMEDINLHFTGDFHAITSANDLLCAAIDNHIYHGNKLDIQKVVFNRCLDVNDRALRNVNVGSRNDSFSITAASEIMALFCLAESLDDLKNRLGDILIGYNSNDEMIFARDLGIEGSLVTLLKDAFNPNLVQTLEHTPTIIHGGPFANIAHGCNSVIATKTALSLGNYVVTEAGFGADLGAEKFLNIKCRSANLSPDCIVLVATVKALKYNGNVSSDDINVENCEALSLGLCNLEKHICNLKKFGVPIVVCINKFTTDSDSEIKLIEDCCLKFNVPCSISTAYVDGGKGAIDLANKVVACCNANKEFKFIYDSDNSIFDKISVVCREIYGARDVNCSDDARKMIEVLEKNKMANLPICIAKTQYSFSDNPKMLGAPKDFSVYVREIRLYNGARFITVLLGNIMTMPGLPIVPNYEKIDFVDGKIIGLS